MKLSTGLAVSITVFTMKFHPVAWSTLASVGLILAMQQAAQAADCITGKSAPDKWGYDRDVLSVVESSDGRQACGRLVIRIRDRDDPRRNVRVFATYVEFEDPSSPAEWRYNHWVRSLLDTMAFDRPIDPIKDQSVEDILAITSLYRSPRFISATFSRWVCCGAHGRSFTGSINIDISLWTLFRPDEALKLDAVANHCWGQFAQQKGPLDDQGEAFKRRYPIARPFTDGDIEGQAVKPAVLDMIGPIIINPNPSVERTVRIFARVLKEQSNWTFAEEGAAVHFGELLGYVGAGFTCLLDNTALKEMARLGFAVPP